MLNIRKFQPNDIFAVIKLASETLTELYYPSLFNYYYETNPNDFIVAIYNYKIIGFLIGIKINQKISKILMFSISKLYQNKKIGTNLLKYYINKKSNENIKIIELEVRTDNKKAINFYKKNSFKIKDTKKGFYQNGEDAYTMVKNI